MPLMPTCSLLFFFPEFWLSSLSISQYLTAHQFYLVEAVRSHGTANMLSSGKTLKKLLEYTQGWWGFAPAPLKLIQMLVLGCCQDCELLIKQLSLTLASRKYLKQGGRTCRSGGIVLKLFKFLLVHTVCTSCSLENSFSESLVLFYFSFHILEFKSFVWIWSVWKCSMKCLLYVSYDSRGTKKILLQIRAVTSELVCSTSRLLKNV